MEFCSKGWCRNATNRFSELTMWNFVGYLNFMFISVAKKTIFTLKSDPFFAHGCSKTIFLGFRKGHSPFAVNGDGTRLRQWLTLLLLCTFVFFVHHLEFMQIWTECLVLKKVEIILFFGSEKLKKCTNDIPNYANFEGWSISLSGTVCPVSGILKLIMADDRPFWIWSSWKFSRHFPTWNRTFCFVVMV